MADPRIEPYEVVHIVDTFVERAHRDAARYENVTLLDDAQVWELHQLAAQIYAIGWQDGERVEAVRQSAKVHRASERARVAAERDANE